MRVVFEDLYIGQRVEFTSDSNQQAIKGTIIDRGEQSFVISYNNKGVTTLDICQNY